MNTQYYVGSVGQQYLFLYFTVMTTLSLAQQQFCKKMQSPWLLRFFLLLKMPIGWLTGMRVVELDQVHASTTVSYQWINRNPFRSIYFSVMAMTAELSTGALVLMAIEGVKPRIACIIVGMEAEFVKKATSRIYFTCHEGAKVFERVSQCISSGEPKTIKLKTEGKTKDGTLVAVFNFTWSFRQRR